MDKLKELNTTTKLVKAILQENKMARNSDMVLFIKVCEALKPEILNMPFWTVLAGFDDYDIPNIESVGRTRRKVQEQHPELRATEKVADKRKQNEEAFVEYSRGIVE